MSTNNWVIQKGFRFTLSIFFELLVLLGASALLLSACGGGGGGSSGGNNGSNMPIITPPNQTGSVSAVFAANRIGQEFFIISWTGNSAGPTASFVQAAGPLTSLHVYAHSGTPAVTQDIAGDANFAMGQWVWGNVTDTTTNTVVDRMNGSMLHAGWHYVLVNRLNALPASGVMVCDTGTFTHPSYAINTGSAVNTAVTTGRNASLSFSASGASYSFTLDTALDRVHTVSFANTNVGNGLTLIGNGLGNGVAGGYGFLSDAGGGAIRINGIFTDNRNAGLSYYGVYSFRCQ